MLHRGTATVQPGLRYAETHERKEIAACGFDRLAAGGGRRETSGKLAGHPRAAAKFIDAFPVRRRVDLYQLLLPAFARRPRGGGVTAMRVTLMMHDLLRASVLLLQRFLLSRANPGPCLDACNKSPLPCPHLSDGEMGWKYRNPGFGPNHETSGPGSSRYLYVFLRASVPPWCKGLVFGSFRFSVMTTGAIESGHRLLFLFQAQRGPLDFGHRNLGVLAVTLQTPTHGQR